MQAHLQEALQSLSSPDEDVRVEGVAAISEVQIPDSDVETTPGAKANRLDTPTGTNSDPFSQVGNSSSITSEFSVYETSRSGEIVDRFHAAAENLLGLGRQRLAQAKSEGKGRLNSVGG